MDESVAGISKDQFHEGGYSMTISSPGEIVDGFAKDVFRDEQRFGQMPRPFYGPFVQSVRRLGEREQEAAVNEYHGRLGRP